MRPSESAPGSDGDRASPPSLDYGGDDGAEDMSPQTSPVKQSASPLAAPASGSDEDDKKEVKLLASVPASGGDEGELGKVVPASGRHHAMAVSWGQLIGDFWFVDPLVDHFHYHESVRLQQVSKDAWANKAIYRSLLHAKGWRPRD